MHLSDIIRFYANPKVREQLLSLARSREVVARYNDKVGSRPDSLIYDNDITQMVKNGATSFHASMERWKNPLLLSQDMKRKEMDELRIGWDLIIDIDCPYLEYSKICADLISQAIEFHGIKNYSIKFSGGSGFHIGVPFESFPKEVNNKETRLLFPDAPRTIADYLQNMIKEKLAEDILEFESIKMISKRTGKKFKELVKDGEFDPYTVINIDTVAISSRHLFRMPYTFNEKKWLISVPIERKEIFKFKERDAEYRNVEVNLGFLDKFKKDEAKQLFLQAFDWAAEKEVEKEIRELSEKYDLPKTMISKEFFPPCIKNILKGLEDGRKRSLFILINFLKSLGWNYNDIEKEIKEWNKRNKEPLRESYINSQLNWHKRVKRYLPPACNNKGYYLDIGVCNPDDICKTIKNPVVYPFKKMKRVKKR
ncbi:MAG: hypothetical protein J7K22_04475 [Nanoarchaeota archaeon]|nr:hypothetical protein [Nanoarchaeota archaeon]